MNLKSYRKNMKSVELAGIIVLFSYSTAVAAFLPGRGVIRTKTKYSMTTTKHINQWIEAEFSPNVTITEVEQSEIDGLSIVDKLADYADNERKRAKESV